MSKIIDGKLIASKIRANISDRINDVLKLDPYFRRPKLVVISVGDNDASKVYMRNKEKACEETGIDFKHRHFEFKPGMLTSETTRAVCAYIHQCNNDEGVDGIIVQLPLPSQFTMFECMDITHCISPRKDVDGFGSKSIVDIVRDCNNGFPYNGIYKPCTPLGIMSMLRIDCFDDISFKNDDYEKLSIAYYKAKTAVVIGRSNIVGKPIASMLMNDDKTVTICHSKTPANVLRNYCKHADIIVSAAGKPGLIDESFVKNGCILIDVSMNRDSNNKLCGDMTQGAYDKSAFYTPVPGGVGPMTVAMLINNTYESWLRHHITNY